MKKFLLPALALGFAALAQARPFTVVAYNVENLVDVDGVAQFDEYQPARYTPKHALTKLQNIARVVAQFENGRGPDILLLAELEVDATPGQSPLDYQAILARYSSVTLEEMLGAKLDKAIADLPAEVLLAKALADRGITGYKIAVGENATAVPGRPLAQTCAIFTRFPIKQVRSHPTTDARAILEVQVEVDGAPLYLFSNHWKSGASDPLTESTRAANAKTLRTRLDEILKADPNADIVIGGDLNSQYNQKQRYPAMTTTGINDVLGAQGNELAIRGKDRDLYNLWYELPAPERGSDTYRGEWGTLMHLIISRGLYDYRGVQYVDNSFAIAKFTGLNADASGLPVRWSGDGPTGAGFSDHFPLAAKFVTVNDGRADRYLDLQKASAEKPTDVEVVKTNEVKPDHSKVELEKVAVVAATLPAGTDIRSEAYRGKIFRVEGTVAEGNRLAVEFLGQTFEVYSYDEALRAKLRADFKAGEKVRFYGEVGQFRGRWQFVIQHAVWVK